MNKVRVFKDRKDAQAIADNLSDTYVGTGALLLPTVDNTFGVSHEMEELIGDMVTIEDIDIICTVSQDRREGWILKITVGDDAAKWAWNETFFNLDVTEEYLKEIFKI